MTFKSTTVQMHDSSKTAPTTHNRSWPSSQLQKSHHSDISNQYSDCSLLQQPKWGICKDDCLNRPLALGVAYRSVSPHRELENYTATSKPIKILRSTTDRLPLRPCSTNIELEFSPPESRQSSPTRSRFSFLPMLTGDTPRGVKIEDKGSNLVNWFKGESEPVNIGILPSPIKEKTDPFEKMPKSLSSITINHTKRSSDPVSATRPTLRSTGTFSFFRAKSSLIEQQPPSLDASDKNTGLASSTKGTTDPCRLSSSEFTDMDIGQALYPTGKNNPISPASFNDFIQNAESLLIRMQTAVKDLTEENDAQTEEAESVKARNKYLEKQLESMAAEAVVCDEILKNMVDELANEKQLRREEARKQTIKLVMDPQTEEMAGAVVKNKGRRQGGFSTASDSGFESEGESFDDGVSKGSRPRSPSFSSMSSVSSPDMPQTPELAYGKVSRKRPIPPLTPLCMADSVTKKDFQASYSVPTVRSHKCQHVECLHCRGMKTSDALGVANMLSEQNKKLERKVELMQRMLKDCLGSF